MNVTNSQPVRDANEMTAMAKFKNASQNNVRNIIFKSFSTSITLNNVEQIDFVGGANKRDYKSDFSISYNGGNIFNVSLKKPNFRSWQSSDSLVGDVIAEKILEYLMEDLDNQDTTRQFKVVSYIENENKKYKIVSKYSGTTTSVAYKCGKSDAKSVIFGDDILGQGVVISNDFSTGTITIIDDTMIVNVDEIYKSLADIRGSLFPYFQINSVREIRSVYRFPGLRVEAKPLRSIGKSIKINTPIR